MPSLQQIATELDVSVSLVSKVLNNRLGTTGARPELAKRIIDTAQRLGYRKNMNAAALRAGRQQTIAVLLHRHGSAGSGLIENLLTGISDATRGAGQRQMISFYGDPDSLGVAVRDLHAGSVDGLIVGGVRHPYLMDELSGLHRAGMPVVTVFNRSISDALPNIAMADDAIIELAMQHLIEHGCRRILHVSSLKDREAGYLRAVSDAGLEADPDLIFSDYGGFNTYLPSNGERAVRRAIERGVAFDAVCAQSDTQAIGAMHELLRHGRRCPEDVLITGVDSSPMADYALVPITSVDQRYEERGLLAVQTLGRLIAGKAPEAIRLEPRLVGRLSTGSVGTQAGSTGSSQTTR